MKKISKVNSVVILGIKAEDVCVQIHTCEGIPSFKIVGLADKTIAESKERVKASLNSIGLALPAKKILINLAPANLSKEGSHLDLPIAVAILSHLSIIPEISIQSYKILGELSLNADILPVPGILPAAVYANSQDQGIICPYKNLCEAKWSANKNILAPQNLIELINHFKGKIDIQTRLAPKIVANNAYDNVIDLKDIKGQQAAKRALTIAAAGSHNLLMYGPPGTGKSMLASSLPKIMPDMNSEQILECSIIYSVAGLIANGALQSKIPFRNPHHSASLPAIIGGGIGKKVKPGEISLAHNGILFLDELPEFNTSVIDSLRQPMETQEVLIARSDAHISYPANFQLIAAMNPCKCGYLGNHEKQCSKAPRCSLSYVNKISGPMLDRFAIRINVENNYQENTTDTQTSSQVKQKVLIARKIQYTRYNEARYKTNAHMCNKAIKQHAQLDSKCQTMLDSAMQKFQLSMRRYISTIKVARTIADLEESKAIKPNHLAEAIHYIEKSY